MNKRNIVRLLLTLTVIFILNISDLVELHKNAIDFELNLGNEFDKVFSELLFGFHRIDTGLNTAKLSQLTSQSADARVIDMTSDSSINELTSRIEALKESNDDKAAQRGDLVQMHDKYIADISAVKEEIDSLSNSIDGLTLKQDSKGRKREERKNECDKLSLDVREHQRKITFLENPSAIAALSAALSGIPLSSIAC